MNKFININGVRINIDHISNYYPGKDGYTNICIDGATDPYKITPEELDEIISDLFDVEF